MYGFGGQAARRSAQGLWQTAQLVQPKLPRCLAAITIPALPAIPTIHPFSPFRQAYYW